MSKKGTLTKLIWAPDTTELYKELDVKGIQTEPNPLGSVTVKLNKAQGAEKGDEDPQCGSR